MIRQFITITRRMLFRPNRFYCALSMGKHYAFKVWEKPGKWCDDAMLQAIVEDITSIVACDDGLDMPDYGFLGGDVRDLENRIITIAYHKRTNKPVGFTAQLMMPLKLKGKEVDVLHLGLSWVVPEHRSLSLPGFLNIIPMLMVLTKYGFRPIWVSNVSQIPAVLGAVASGLSTTYPDTFGHQQQQPIHRVLATAIMEQQRHVFGVAKEAGFDLKKQLITEAYTGGSDNLKKSYAECPKHREDQVNAFCRKYLDYDRGDDFLQLGLMDKGMIERFLSSKSLTIDVAYEKMARLALRFFSILSPLLRFRTKHQQKFNYDNI